MKLSYCRYVTGALLAAASMAQATTNGFFVPSWRGAANSEAGYWENFSIAEGAPGNLADHPGSTTGAVLTQNNPGAFLTGTFNIYNMATNSAFSLSDSVPFTLGTVLVQTYVQGTELDYGSMSLTYTDINGSHSASPVLSGELFRTSGGLGAVAHFWQWDLSALNITGYTLTFEALGPHASFDAMTLDTWDQFSAVPEPTVAVLGAMGGLALLARKRFQGGKV